ncbi:MAG: chromophore lyase CpcT/CpeT [Parasphingorhabdus sp.]
MVLVALIFSQLAAGCAPSEDIIAIDGQENGQAVQLAGMMAGRFAEQGDIAIYDFRAKLPSMGEGQWLYYQRDRGKRDAGDTREAYRQRVLQLVNRPDGKVAQITWSLKEPAGYAVAPNDPVLLASLTRDALVPTLEPGCQQIWVLESGTWRGRVDPAQCTIFSKRRNQRIAIGSETRLTKSTLQEAERGFDLDGKQLWGTAPGAFSTMQRVNAD